MASESTPRLRPVPESDWNEEMREVMELSGRGRGSGDEKDFESGSSDFFPVLVRHTKLFKRWLPFAGTLLRRGRIPAA